MIVCVIVQQTKYVEKRKQLPYKTCTLLIVYFRTQSESKYRNDPKFLDSKI